MKNVDIYNLPKPVYVFDIEGNGLHDVIDTAWCISVIDADSEEVYKFRPDEIDEGVRFLEKGGTVIGHNIIDFDNPALIKLHSFNTESLVIVDTFILSQMLQPQRPSHSLESYGEEVGIAKVENEDWSVFTEHMLHRCVEDTRLTLAIFKKFQKEAMPISEKRMPQIDWTDAINLEHYIATEVSKQSVRGCPIRVDKLHQYIQFLENEVDVMYHGVEQLLGYRYKATETPVTRLFKKDGTLYVNVEKYWENASECVEGPYCKVEYEPIRLTMHNEVKNILLHLGWKPTQFTPKGSPKLPKGDEWDRIAEMSGNEGLKALATYGSLKNRLDILKGWRDSLRDDNTIRHGAFTCGTPTARFRHSGIVNVPRATVKGGEGVFYPDKQGSVFGSEMRHLIHCNLEGCKQVGIDLAGIELRLLAHIINDPEFTDVILNGDVHTFFWEKAKKLVDSRSSWKTSWYAWQFGAMDKKLGTTCTNLPEKQRTAKAGAAVRTIIEDSVPSLGKAIEAMQKAAKRGWIRGLDGRKIFVHSVKDTLNRYIQSAAAILFKHWVRDSTEKCKEANLNFFPLIYYHDEIQSFVKEVDIDKYVEINIQSIKEVGEMFNLNIPIDGEAIIGNDWLECH